MGQNTQNMKVVSFIIPAFNEEVSIRDTINAIQLYSPHYPYEIIVVDNASTDRTSEIVISEDAVLIKQPKDTIALARNRGALSSEGQVLIFLDADVLLTVTWQQEIDKVVDALLKNSSVITGSRCNITDEGRWISRFWFARMQNEKPNYINSGHLITSRELFVRLGGFNKELHTAEDYDICMRAKQSGAEIINNPNLYVIHTGYPTTLKDFIARERWHGSEDFASVYNILKSKVALVVIMNLLLLLGALFTTVFSGNLYYMLVYFAVFYMLSIVSTVLKFGFGSMLLLVVTSSIFLFYYVGRSLSLIDRFMQPINSKG